MTFTVYALSHPDEPNLIRYVGRTGVDPRKRLSDHISATKFRVKNGIQMPPVMHWIQDLLLEHKRPIITTLSRCKTEDAAISAEMTLIRTLTGTILNSPLIMYCVGGKKLGHHDTPEAVRNKRLARAEVKTPEYHIKVREEQGYPRPDLSISHPENISHRNFLRSLRPDGVTSYMNEHCRKWRQEVGAPNPEVRISHRDNRSWYAENRHNIKPFSYKKN